MIGLNQHETEQAPKHVFLLFSPRAAPNWFGEEIAQKSAVYQNELRERICYSSARLKGFCGAQGLKTFSEFEKNKQRSMKRETRRLYDFTE